MRGRREEGEVGGGGNERVRERGERMRWGMRGEGA